MSSGLAVKPIAHRCWATSAGPREALLVTNSVAGADYGQGIDGARRGFMAAEDGAVEVEQ